MGGVNYRAPRRGGALHGGRTLVLSPSFPRRGVLLFVQNQKYNGAAPHGRHHFGRLTATNNRASAGSSRTPSSSSTTFQSGCWRIREHNRG